MRFRGGRGQVCRRCGSRGRPRRGPSPRGSGPIWDRCTHRTAPTSEPGRALVRNRAPVRQRRPAAGLTGQQRERGLGVELGREVAHRLQSPPPHGPQGERVLAEHVPESRGDAMFRQSPVPRGPLALPRVQPLNERSRVRSTLEHRTPGRDGRGAAAEERSGPSGNPISSRYDDRLSLWRRGELAELRVPRAAAELSVERTSAVLTFRPA